MSIRKSQIKSLMLIAVLLACSLLFGSCEKDAEQGLIQFTLLYAGQPVTNATIHAKNGTLTDPNISFDQYDAHIRADAFGEYWYKDVNPGDHFFYATANVNGVAISGSASLHVEETARHNMYDVVIVME
jgi:hypothetical protein